MEAQITLYSKAINIVDNIEQGNQAMAVELFDKLNQEVIDHGELKCYDNESNPVTINRYANGHIVYTDRTTVSSSNPAVFIELSKTSNNTIAFEHYEIDSKTGKRTDK